MKHKASGSTVEQDLVPSSTSINAGQEEMKSISKAKYHAKAFAINSKQVGKAILHGPARVITEKCQSRV